MQPRFFVQQLPLSASRRSARRRRVACALLIAAASAVALFNHLSNLGNHP